MVMRVEIALFDGDTLMERGEIAVTSTRRVNSFQLYKATHKLDREAADIVLDDFASHVELKKSTLRMPIHESTDWETIELDRYTLAFWCHLDA